MFGHSHVAAGSAHDIFAGLAALQRACAPAAKLSLRDAVMMNGFLVHGLDYDDTHVPGIATNSGTSG